FHLAEDKLRVRPELLAEIRPVHVILQQLQSDLYGNPRAGVAPEMLRAAMTVRRHRDGESVCHADTGAVLTHDAPFYMAVAGHGQMKSLKHPTIPHQTRYPGRPDPPDRPRRAHPAGS